MRAHVFTHLRDTDRDKSSSFVPRIEFDVWEETDAHALNWIGKELNQGEGHVGLTYRNANFPPLGVGDLVVLDRERWWLCEATGWKSVDRPEDVRDERIEPESERTVRRQGL